MAARPAAGRTVTVTRGFVHFFSRHPAPAARTQNYRWAQARSEARGMPRRLAAGRGPGGRGWRRPRPTALNYSAESDSARPLGCWHRAGQAHRPVPERIICALTRARAPKPPLHGLPVRRRRSRPAGPGGRVSGKNSNHHHQSLCLVS